MNISGTATILTGTVMNTPAETFLIYCLGFFCILGGLAMLAMVISTFNN